MDSIERRVVTLRDVAERAGVSTSTVSRVLDERAPRSRSATAERVRRVADELGYRRNVVASSLRRGGTGTIGVLVPRLTDTVMAMMYEALERQARRRGYFAVVATSGDDPEDERRSTETLLDRNVEGVVLATARLDDALPASLRERGVPHALVLRTDGASPSALGDDETGGYLAVRHLLDLGHRDIAIVTGPSFTSSANDRVVGARRALAERGVSIPGDSVRYAGYGIDDGLAAGEQLFTSGRPTAVFAANDNLAIGVMRAAHTAGRVVGRDLALVGYNDIPLAARLPVPLTSVRVPFEQIAADALDLVLRPEGGHPVRRALPTLIPRATSISVGGS
ncbi:LacI family DNA-binding transcriptional regulator [Isoptericola variabilis]|uniref:Transcriptional regulator, LacI family n=1 Tax=Isoptericola variabilis (strain 225) TaxID=743718 RepID=F6FX42_ISOV2|nr:LacI family DNA-binding transcriptional regulator [Isoptericola variabilis]AEG44642.1 transcriptional regulator, LacI family [Isoptericola variabilis 225]TWH28333.1 LacI family transcriptional regulator [Isoptericola variabilis J7]